MTEEQQAKLANALILALDVDTIDDATAIVDRIGPLVERYKVGSRLFTAVGPTVLHELEARGKKVFLDLKYHDIPTVICDTVRLVATRFPSVFMLTVHASGGASMVAHAVDAAMSRIGGELSIVAVTALTSLSPSETRTLGIDMNLDAWVLKLGDLALEAGAHGLVCSPNELSALRDRVGAQPMLVTAGVRPVSTGRMTGDDQARIATPATALANGASFIVMGRPVVRAKDPASLLAQIAATL